MSVCSRRILDESQFNGRRGVGKPPADRSGYAGQVLFQQFIVAIPLPRLPAGVGDEPANLGLGQPIRCAGRRDHVFLHHDRAHVVGPEEEGELADLRALRDPGGLQIGDVVQEDPGDGEGLEVVVGAGQHEVFAVRRIGAVGLTRRESAERRVLRLEGPADEMVVVVEEQFRALPARIAIVRTYNAQSVSDFPAAVKYAELAIKLAPEEDHFLRAQTNAILGGTYWANGDLDAACKSMSDWIDNAQKAGNFIFAIASASGKADILTAQGHLREALKTYQQSLQLALEYEAESQRIIAHHYLGLALLYHEMWDDESAAQHFHKSLELGQQSLLRDWSYRKCLAQARLKESEGDLDAALDLLDDAQRFYARSLIPYTRPIDALKVSIYLKQGRLSNAQEWVREHGFSVDDGLSYLHEFEHITLARVLLAKYQVNRKELIIHDALSLLKRLLQAAEDQKRMGSILEILIVTALASHALGSISQAFASLERALILARQRP